MTDRRLAFSPRFTQDFKYLRKRYRRIENDLRPLLDLLRRGDTPGDQMMSVGHAVYKARLPNRDAQRGKSGGYRVVYYLQTADQIVMLTMYSKSEQSDIPADAIRRIIQEFEAG